MNGTVTVNGILHLYSRPTTVFERGAPTIMEHIDAFRRHSRFRVWAVNTELEMPAGLEGLQFSAVVLHYSLFGTVPYRLGSEFLRYLGEACADSYKVAFFQDEFRFCRTRFAFLNEHAIDCVYSCLEPEYLEEVYGQRTGVSTLRSNVPGYVGGALADAAARLSVPEARRRVDMGYRGRSLPAYAGRGGREKADIGLGFLERSRGCLDLTMDIAVGEQDRIYGDDWYRFVGGCTCVLGTESGVDVFDLEDKVYTEYEELAADGHEVTVEELERGSLPRWEGRIPYRTISPRHFEAAALGTCQVLYEGRYSGAMRPMVHYIPLRKDFSNFDEVIDRFRDPDVRRELTSNARRDLIDSGAWSYRRFVAGFDETLMDAGVKPEIADEQASRVDAALRHGRRSRLLRSQAKDLRQRARSAEFPGKSLLRPVVRALRRS
jgi:hypothetical protein